MKFAPLAFALSRGLALNLASVTAFADDTSANASDDESGIVCQAKVVSSKGNTFIYQLHGAGSLLEDGTLQWSSGDIFFDVLVQKAGARKPSVILDDVAPVDLDGGMWHRYYSIPGSLLGILLDVSHMGAGIVVHHKITANEELTATGRCMMVE